MNSSLVPTLQHLASSRVVTSLFSHLEVDRNFRLSGTNSLVQDAIQRLTPCARVQGTLEKFIDPLVEEIFDCLHFFRKIKYGFEDIRFNLREVIPRCWLSDGTIDREKLARFVVENTESCPVNRFIFACTFCFFSEALAAWDVLLKIEKAYIRHKRSTSAVKLWIEWLESNPTKDWESFVAWSVGTPLWHTSVPFLKHAWKTLSPEEACRHLCNAVIGKEVSDEVMRFCISVVTKGEQKQILKESALQVFSCMLSWPLRTIFFDRKENLWPYLTEQSFRSVLKMILKKIRNQITNDFELLTALKEFWAESPPHFRNAAKYCPQLFELVEFMTRLELTEFIIDRKNFQNVYDRCVFISLALE